MKIIMWLIVAVVIVGGLAWFMSSDSSQDQNKEGQNIPSEITPTSSINSDEDVFNEIDLALSGLE